MYQNTESAKTKNGPSTQFLLLLSSIYRIPLIIAHLSRDSEAPVDSG